MCANSYVYGYTPNKLPFETQEGTWGVLGGQQFKSLGKMSDWQQLWFTSSDSSGNVHRLNTRRPALGGGGVRVSQIQKSGEAVKWLDPLAPNLAHLCRSIWEWIYAKQIAPRDTGGHLGGLWVKHSKVWGSTDWHRIWFTSADSSGNGHRLNTQFAHNNQGHLGGG